MQILPTLTRIYGGNQGTDSLSADDAVDLSGQMVKGLQADIGRYARAVVAAVDAQFKRENSDAELLGKWQTWKDLPHVEWKIDTANPGKTLSSIRATKGQAKELFEVNATPKLHGSIKWKSSNPHLGIVLANLEGIRGSGKLRQVVGTQFSGWQLGSFANLTNNLTKTSLVNGDEPKGQILRTLMPVVLSSKEAFSEDKQIARVKKISSNSEFRRLDDGFKILVDNDGELIVRMKDDQIISVERRNQDSNMILAIVKSRGKLSLNPTDAKVVFFNGLTTINGLPDLNRNTDDLTINQYAPKTIEVLLREAEAIRDLYFYGNSVTSSHRITKDYCFERIDNPGGESYFKVKGPKDNELEVRMNTEGKIMSIQQRNAQQLVSVMPTDHEPVNLETKVDFYGPGSKEFSSTITTGDEAALHPRVLQFQQRVSRALSPKANGQAKPVSESGGGQNNDLFVLMSSAAGPQEKVVTLDTSPTELERRLGLAEIH